MRCAEGRDAPAIAEMMTEAISKRLASWPVPFSHPMAEEKISAARGAAVERRSLPLVLERKSDGAICGWVSLMCPPGDDRVALTTYWLGEQYQGQGLMREAGPVAVELAFKSMDIDRLRAAVQPDNAASLAVIRLLGFTPMGEGRIWCPARGVEETCLWFEKPRPLLPAWAAGAALAKRDVVRQVLA
ncbi:MAG: GNAT family N-acetyltransferase [Roseomonas sp.]|nr:GNAT family N-acetyltransferase [Roseomonas sp.]MCA3331841.1 GNAT family N-acetyltransferase [Roseomonas sp.]MCA3336689.1 GNAT family N-acetyltransferase [Roseomonas sp.]MCA3345720.1 GNAT family N-acetyltransferase [Roseomonas sp.]MCA3355533.1 GNAT family N-acetyltransferase [Roseomonas sp.]